MSVDWKAEYASERGCSVLDRMGDRPDRLAVGGILIREGSVPPEVLLLKRGPDQEYAGIEELPSGGVEGNETLVEALEREIAEETGLQGVLVGEMVFQFEYDSVRGRAIQFNFVVSVGEAWPISLDTTEHVSHRWVSRGELESSDLTLEIRSELLALPMLK